MLSNRQIQRAAVILQPSTLLKFHDLLKHRKYQRLFSSSRKPGPKGPSKELIQAIIELKQRNPQFVCLRIAQLINTVFGVNINKVIVRRVLTTHFNPDNNNGGPSWLTFLGHTKDSLWSTDIEL